MKKFIIILILALNMVCSYAGEVAFLGVITQDISYNEYVEYGLSDGYGILVKKVIPSSSAAKADIKEGMILRRFDKEKLYTPSQLTKMIETHSAGDKVSVMVYEDGAERTINLELGSRKFYERENAAWLGLRVSEKISHKDFKESYGLQVQSLHPESEAENSGLEVDDVILSINDDKLYSRDQLRKILQGYEPGDEVKILFWRKGKTQDVELVLDTKPMVFSDGDVFEILGELPEILEDIDIDIDLDELYSTITSSGLPDKVHFFTIPDSSEKFLGVIASALTDKAKSENGLERGVLIKSVIPETTAEEGGLKEGDIIVEIAGEPIEILTDISRAIYEIDEGDKFTIKILRDKKEQELEMQLKGGTSQIKKYYLNDDNYMLEMLLDDDSFKWFDEDSLDVLDMDEIELRIEKKEAKGSL